MPHNRLVPFLIFYIIGISLDAQNEVFQFECNKEENLESALERFGKKYDIKLSYPAYILDQIYPGSVSLESNSLEELFTLTLQPSDIEYQVLDGKKVLLRKVNHYKMNLQL